MDEPLLSKRQIGWIVILSILTIMISISKLILPRSAEFVMCDVGQGDGMFIRTSTGVRIIVDAGPGPQIMECLGKEMGFFERTIDIAFLTNSQKDHFGGFEYIIQHYTIKNFIGTSLAYDSPEFRHLEKILLKKNVPLSILYKDDVISLGPKSSILFFWPTRTYVASNTIPNRNSQSILSQDSGSLDPNKMSQVFLFKDGNFDVVFTGDGEQDALTNIISDNKSQTDLLVDGKKDNTTCISDVCKLSSTQAEVLKIPHHGSKNGLIPEFYELADPMVSVISAGRKNRYGHPSSQTISVLKASKRPYFLTAKDGTIKIEYDTLRFRIKKSRT